MKKALLVVSFGTSYPDTCEKNIVACERELAASCPDRDTFRAFTSGMIIRKLKQRDGIEIDTPLQALQKLAEQGYQDVAIQSLHIINGDEYEKIVREVQSLRPLFLRLTLGAPLLSSHNDYVQLMQALRQQVARRFGPRVLLTTGSKDLARWRAGLGEKTLLARVLPVADVIAQCAGLGFGVGEIFALCGPFSAEFNAAFYRQCRADVVITKASGAEGGYQEKVQPCLDAGIPCIVITRPAPLVTGEELLESQAAFARRLARWLAAA
ncbi:hypothetical protein KLMIMMO121B_16380 [Klebsiella michiganensis]|uniref:precorrin-6A/cobalt-precorrin-6A reductase n=6 Tax=Klebsiella TaxID=570 RepID=UPI003B25D582